MLDKITFGITAFERPQHLETTVRSILKRYPGAHIVVADNGKLRARLPSQVELLEMPFDCGLSRCRNALIERLDRPYLMLLDDDFVFTPETRIDRLFRVLDHDPEVGCVGGAVVGGYGKSSTYAMEIEVFRGVMHVRPTSHRRRVTSCGVGYVLCDMVWNFALFRREMLADHQWDEELKVGEHAPYFWEVKKAGNWRSACVPTVSCFHAVSGRSQHYNKHRYRARDFFNQYAAKQGIHELRRERGMEALRDQFETRPNIVVLGVGHSGTSVFTRMLHAAGWSAWDADQQYAESVRIRLLNLHATRTHDLPPDLVRAVLQAIPRPFAIKDPRFVHTLHLWLPYFAQLNPAPVLVRLVRDPDAMTSSYLRRGFRGDPRAHLAHLNDLADNQYENWPFGRVTIQYEQIAEAASLFDIGRSKQSAIRDEIGQSQPAASAYQQQGLSEQMPAEVEAAFPVSSPVRDHSIALSEDTNELLSEIATEVGLSQKGRRSMQASEKQYRDMTSGEAEELLLSESLPVSMQAAQGHGMQLSEDHESVDLSERPIDLVSGEVPPDLLQGQSKSQIEAAIKDLDVFRKVIRGMG